MYTELSLPPLSKQIKDYVSYVQSKYSDDRYFIKAKKFAEGNNPNINCAGCLYHSDYVLTYLLKKEFGNLFSEDFKGQLLQFKNLNPSFSTASYPPHTDVGKALNINYVLDTGGPNVKTVFYDTPQFADTLDGITQPHQNLTTHTILHTEPNHWYMLDVKKLHSVESIDTCRTVLCLGFKSISYNDFVIKYNSLLK